MEALRHWYWGTKLLPFKGLRRKQKDWKAYRRSILTGVDPSNCSNGMPPKPTRFQKAVRKRMNNGQSSYRATQAVLRRHPEWAG